MKKYLNTSKFLKYALILLLSPIYSGTLAQNSQILNNKIRKITDNKYNNLDKLYKYFHANPEVSFQEKNTSKRVANELKQLGFQVTENFGGYGVVGVYKNGNGPTIMVRADMDALPVKEQTGLPYASKKTTQDNLGKVVPVMHACGHDIHMSVMIGTAQTLIALKSSWKGTLLFIGQPAEERSGGAIAMLKQGLFEKFPRPDYVLSLHASASLEAGKVAYKTGPALANVDMVDIFVYGEGGHGAYPHTTKDPIVLASRIVMALQTIVSRVISPFEPAVVTVGAFHAGTKHNIISGEAHLQLTLRSYSDEVRNKTIAEIKRMIKHIAISAGMPKNKLPKMVLRDEYTPVTFNHVALTKRLKKVATDILGKQNTEDAKAVMAGEDFGRFGRTKANIPICLFWLGTVDPAKVAQYKKAGKQLPSLHSAFFAPVPEKSIKTGVQTLTASVIDLLNNK
ncbi:amidohydrolase [uncultured Microscilla sp.]|uniref:amidohydrolase n=1 Tax=uncultured Microscilla sp. TaxID=432653 RepID=UPI002635BDFD|nr:amidohydrolase [uncultured Microscilla sp.]